MTKLACAAFALAISLAGCVIDDVGTPPPSTDEQDEETTDEDGVPIDPSSTLPEDAPCAATSFDDKGDGPCAP
ncbi:MAG TPA: hypothetical protein VIV11_05725 [Kofleriaceae bacterium]